MASRKPGLRPSRRVTLTRRDFFSDGKTAGRRQPLFVVLRSEMGDELLSHQVPELVLELHELDE